MEKSIMGSPAYQFPKINLTKEEKKQKQYQVKKEIRQLRKELGRCIYCDKDKSQNIYVACSDCRDSFCVFIS